ncbi:hypothetical protein C8F04DRAFT_1099341 [Mycena alexandri]|uniref:SnoaL-like domain-containing protein n=1 Tax=Mycena alexandri TaxID=1745969 RepID=A0AAD6X512_9AGAR|nr:hypothetical protein C8F04DRAFT_1099341 [Mycena alexandri]
MSDLNAKQLENAHAFLKHLNALEWGPLADLMASNFKHQYFPSTIVPPDGKETRGKEEFMGVLQQNFIHVFEKVTFGEPLDVIHGVNKVVFHLKSDGMSKSGKKYNNEYMVTFHFDGEKMIRLNEFVDSKYSSAFFTALRAEASS